MADIHYFDTADLEASRQRVAEAGQVPIGFHSAETPNGVEGFRRTSM
jgi:hypothetical protein